MRYWGIYIKQDWEKIIIEAVWWVYEISLYYLLLYLCEIFHNKA